MCRHERVRKKNGILSIAATILVVVSSCSQPSFFDLLNGPDGIPLQVNPATAQIVTGQALELQASGGQPPYTYSLSGGLGGTGEDLSGTIYSAPTDTTGFVTITVKDNYGAVTRADIEVIDSTGPGPGGNDVDYAVISPANTGSTVGGGALSGEFRITNSGQDDGISLVSWTVHTSDDNILGAGDVLIDSGTVSALVSSDTSDPVSFSGTWPLSGIEKTCYLIISVSAADELPQSNNIATISETITVAPVADVDYQVSRIDDAPASVPIDDAISLSFDITNVGGDSGSATVNWTAYISQNTSFDIGDTQVDSGSFAALGAGLSSIDISINGSWSAGTGERYILVKVDASDDINSGNDVRSSNAVIVLASASDIDYIVSEISNDYPTVTIGSLIAETFDISNIGGAAGSDTIGVSVYVSEDESWDVGDTHIPDDQAFLTGLAAGSSHTGIPIYGAWPNEVGTRYLIVEVSSNNETITDNNRYSAGPFTLRNPPDYAVTDTVFGSDGTPNSSFSDSGTWKFTISEVADVEGSQPISWEVFATTDGVVRDGDEPVKSGSISALAAGTVSDYIYFSDGLWPDFGSYYTVIISIHAGDDGNRTNNSATSSLIPVPEAKNHDGSSDGVGPATETGIAGAMHLYPDLDGDSTLDRLQYIRVTSTWLDNSEDCFEFITGTGVTSVEIWAEWTDPALRLNLYFWDESENEWKSEDWTQPKTRQPILGVFAVNGLVENSRYYLGVNFLDHSPGTSYDLHIYAP